MVWLFLTASGQAQEEAAASRALMSKEKAVKEKGADEVKMKTKTMSGEVSARGPSGIAVVYEKDKVKHSSKEMWFPYDLEVKIKLTGYKEKTDITEGDTVVITYDEAEDGSKKILTGIRLLKKKPQEEEVMEEEASVAE
jgi:hypothetical protein